jgi:branched-chain amino acid transport system permease protein
VYFLVASGLSLIYGLMGVLNFAHGALITIGAYAGWWLTSKVSGGPEVRLLAGTVFAVAFGALVAVAIEVVFIRRLYLRPLEQILVTVGLALALGALVQGIFGSETKALVVPSWMIDTTTVFGEPVPNDRFVEIVVAGLVLVSLVAFLRFTRYGLVIRAGVENRAMVTALGVDVRRAFTFVFALGGALAALAGVLASIYFASVDPSRGTELLIYAFIVVVIGGFGSIGGAALAAVAVALLQNYANFYGTTGAGDMAVVVLLAVTLLVRPHGLAPKVTH